MSIAQFMAADPKMTVGQKVRFDVVPNGSYCTTGEVYTVTHVDSQKVFFEAPNGSGTSDHKAVIARTAKWNVV